MSAESPAAPVLPLPVLPPVNDAHRLGLAPIATPDRLLLGPGPSNAHPMVLQALARTPTRSTSS